MQQLTGKVFITGGTGTIGNAIVRRATEEKWDCGITVFSRDWKRQADMKRKYPHVTYVLGDILDSHSLSMAICGHDIVIHAAAMKHIVRGEENPLQCIEVNVNGSINVLQACVENGVEHIIGISTDKACHPINAYGASKMLMEKAFQQYASSFSYPQFHLVRYGNVLGSSGSFIHNWRACQEAGEPVWSTDPEMTRFWLTEDEAVNLIMLSLDFQSGEILVPLLKSVQVGNIEKWVLGKPADIYIGMRPGEKVHEELLREEEIGYYFSEEERPTYFIVYPSTSEFESNIRCNQHHNSFEAERFTKEEFLAMLGDL
jgi:FlaA1/EpsC-like NDP-sugar epimerase